MHLFKVTGSCGHVVYVVASDFPSCCMGFSRVVHARQERWGTPTDTAMSINARTPHIIEKISDDVHIEPYNAA